MSDGPWLLDTAILIDVLRGRSEALAWLSSPAAQPRAISVVTAFELLAGCRDLREQRIVDRELAGYATLPLDEASGDLALAYYREHHLRDGTGFLDCLIAATAVIQGCRLATLNVRHFASLAGLTVVAPYQS